jgi:hypothetical protein
VVADHGHDPAGQFAAGVEQQKFAEEFEAQLSTFKRFAESTSEYVPYLIRKAERVEEYLQQR